MYKIESGEASCSLQDMSINHQDDPYTVCLSTHCSSNYMKQQIQYTPHCGPELASTQNVFPDKVCSE